MAHLTTSVYFGFYRVTQWIEVNFIKMLRQVYYKLSHGRTLFRQHRKSKEIKLSFSYPHHFILALKIFTRIPLQLS